LFRGQARDWRPLRTSLARLDENDREEAKNELRRFEGWVKGISALNEIASDVDATFAVAQHYGLPTNYMDFTTEPRIAAFFAAFEPPTDLGDKEFSCIICVNTQLFADFSSQMASVRPKWVEPRRVNVDIAELWRIQAQSGVFLFLPYFNFEDAYEFDRIYFPAYRGQPCVPKDDVYPRQKSDLEILLEQYFMKRRMRDIGEIFRPEPEGVVTIVMVDGFEEGIDKECFGKEGLPIHESWKKANLIAWQKPKPEKWSEYSKAPKVDIVLPTLRDPVQALSHLAGTLIDKLKKQPDLRNGPVIWRCNGVALIEESLTLFWDGSRRWPYNTEDIAFGLALTAVFAALSSRTSHSITYSHIAEELLYQCLGPIIEVEITMEDDSYTRGYARQSDLARAVREDFPQYLKNKWRPKITKIQHRLQVANVPSRVFDFGRLSHVFVQQIAPTQVVLRGENSGKARLYNIARAAKLGLP